MHIEYQINEDDFASAGRLAVQAKSRWAGIQRYFLAGFGVLLIVCGVITGIIGHAFSALWGSLLWGAILLGISVLYGFYGYQFRRIYRKSPLLTERRTLDVDEHNLQFKAASSEGRTTWEAYIKYAENKDTFIIFQQGNQIFIPIPKRDLTAPQIDELRTLLQAHLPRK
jgi:YcxB-like protein